MENCQHTDSYERCAKELAESYINGNRLHVRDELLRLSKRDALLVFANLIPVLSDDDNVVLRRLLYNTSCERGMRPEEFAARMRSIQINGLRSVVPAACITLAAEMLQQLGYTEGAKVLDVVVERFEEETGDGKGS